MLGFDVGAYYLMALPSSHSLQVESLLLLSSMSMSISSWHCGHWFQCCRMVPNHSVGLVLSSLESLLPVVVPSPGCCGGISQVTSSFLSQRWDFLILMWFAILELDGELVSWMEGRKEERKWTMTKVVVHCWDAPDGPPTSWVSLYVSPSSIPLYPLFPPSSESVPPTSLWKGEGWTGPHFQMRWGIWIWAHIPQERGGAHFRAIACGRQQIEVARVKIVVVGWVEDEQISTVMWLMCI